VSQIRASLTVKGRRWGWREEKVPNGDPPGEMEGGGGGKGSRFLEKGGKSEDCYGIDDKKTTDVFLPDRYSQSNQDTT